MTIAEFFMIRPHGPNCWKGLGAFKLLVRLKIRRENINFVMSTVKNPMKIVNRKTEYIMSSEKKYEFQLRDAITLSQGMVVPVA